MSRRLDHNGTPETIDPQVIEQFLSVHIPYRLAMLDFADEVFPPRSTRDSAFVEAAIVAGRLLLQFLGLGIDHRGGLRLVERRSYFASNGCTDEIKIPDVGGRFVDIASLDSDTRKILAHYYNGASKASAHLTWDSGHQLDPDTLVRGIRTIHDLVSTHLPKHGTGT